MALVTVEIRDGVSGAILSTLRQRTQEAEGKAATAALEPVSTTGSSSSSHTGSSSSHTGSSSSTGTTVVHSGATTSSSQASSSGSSSSHATSASGGGYTAVTTTEDGAVQVPDNANPYVEPIVNSRTGRTEYYVSSLDPNAGSWLFKLNNGTDYTTANYDEALLIEAALKEVGGGPRIGAQSWSYGDGTTYYTYEEAWAAYEQQLAQTLQRLANNGNTTENGQMNEQALLAAMMQQQQQQSQDATTTADDVTEYNYDTTPAETKKKNTWLWWLLGGAVVVSGILIYRSNKKRR